MNGLALGLTFLTRLPVPVADVAPGDWRGAVRWFPLAGALVAIVSLFALALGSFLWTPLVGGVGAIAAAVWVTGALHVDGWADCLDGMHCNGDREKVLAVMHDPRAGAIGAAGAALLLLTKVALVAASVEAGTGAAAVWAAAVCSRAFLAAELYAGEPATPGKGLFARVAAEVRLVDALLAALVATVLVVPALVLVPSIGAGFAVGLAASGAATIAWQAWWRERIGGLNGDVIGAAVELREVLLLGAMATSWLG